MDNARFPSDAEWGPDDLTLPQPSDLAFKGIRRYVDQFADEAILKGLSSQQSRCCAFHKKVRKVLFANGVVKTWDECEAEGRRG